MHKTCRGIAVIAPAIGTFEWGVEYAGFDEVFTGGAAAATPGLQGTTMHRAIGDTTKLMNHAVISAGRAAGAVAQLGAPAAPQFWTLQSEPDRLLGQSKRDGRQADVELVGSSRTTFIRIYLALGDVSDHHMAGQSIHPCEFPKNANHGLKRIEPLTLEEVPQTGTEFVFLERQDGVERHRHALMASQPATHC